MTKVVDTFQPNSTVPLSFEVLTTEGVLAAPGAATLTIVIPDATSHVLVMSNPSTGVYTYDYLAVPPGRYVATFVATGANAGTSKYLFSILDTALSPTYASMADLQNVDLVSDAYTLRAAAERIDQMLVGAIYSVDDAGMPTDSGVADALKRATIAQLRWMQDSGDSTGFSAGMGAMKIGEISWSRPRRGGDVAGSMFAPNAQGILQVAGLIPVSAMRRR